MDCNILNNFKSNNLTKIIERTVDSHLNKYLFDNNLNGSRQSAYINGHSTETVLVRKKNYIMMSIDQGKSVILVFVDLAAVFAIVDHNVLFSRLKDIFQSFLEQGFQNVLVRVSFQFSHYYLVYYRVQFLVFYLSQCDHNAEILR